MSKRELRALPAARKGPETTGTRLGTNFATRRERTGTQEAMSEETIEELRAQVADLQLQLWEAQDAIQAADEELKRVSGECERVSAEARGVHDLASSLRDFMGSGPGSLSTFLLLLWTHTPSYLLRRPMLWPCSRLLLWLVLVVRILRMKRRAL